jgi:hypothetical protein
MTLAEIIVELRARASQTVPFAGDALGDLKRGAAYAAAKDGTLGVETFWFRRKVTDREHRHRAPARGRRRGDGEKR